MSTSWIAGGFVALTQLFPKARPALWRHWYNALAARDTAGELSFMNYGFSETDGSGALALQPADEPYRYPIQLYAHVTHSVEISGKDVIEVGCGRGGGGAFLLRYRAPRSFTGVDLSDAAIAWCAARHRYPNARWVQGRADALPVPEAGVDVVVNVESSHTYPSMRDFLKEVVRVLRPGGHLAFCDLRSKQGLDELAADIKAAGLTQCHYHVITPQVLKALERVSQQRETQIASGVPTWLRKTFRDFAGLRGTVLYRMMQEGKMVYVSALLQKTSAAATP